MKIVGDKITFTSGRERYASNGIIGLGPDGEVTEGYDGSLWSVEEVDWREPEACLSPADRVELADYMIERWKTFRDKAFASVHSQGRSSE
jgi:hypothetical protein